ncbi:glycosyltransferase family 4 protein [Candidatus Woesebacteria bacterium]|nr:glycosyltransferase family 4 protein [Candidatus Woesebacteria bacterium]MCD8506896.1 glycosyltransferase family 4 protein [Candidatus Woesebacteria bacterium]MCD8527485.1 glycosyltransferase family 4 protein [Candidatus Woesebacteria bacterium]MCD8546226.1 glycosyltransferase family 4 protein [Candidatus Woesebacteria bacterium]
MQVLLNTEPLQNANSTRGVGTYTRELLQSLRELADLPEPLVVHATHELAEFGTQVTKDADGIDVIHYPFFDLFFSTLPARSKTPVVVTVHDVIPLVFPEEYKPGLKGQWRFQGQKKRLQGVDAIITDSEASRADIIEHLDISSHKVHVVPLAAGQSLQPVSDYYAQKYTEELKLPAKYILYVGDINYNKNLPTLLLALTQIPEDIHLCVVSQTFRNTTIPEGQQLAEIIKANDLESRVHVLDIPKGDDEKLAAVISKARCLIQPSLYEGFGLPVLEALQVGTVVVSADTSSLPEVVGDAAILVDPTITGLADGIQQAVALRGTDRQDMIERGFMRANMFSWSKTARATYDIYRQVVQENQ